MGLATVALLIALRLALGCHFLYEGVWKITHPVQFAAETEGFLTGARGPAAGLFFAMVPDIDGRARLSGEPIADDEPAAKGEKPSGKDQAAKDKEAAKAKAAGKAQEGGKKSADSTGKTKSASIALIRNDARTRAYEGLRDRFVAAYPGKKDPAARVCKEQLRAAEQYLAEQWGEIQVYFEALDRFQASRKTSPDTAFQRKRDRDTMVKLRGEAKVWLADLDARKAAYKEALRGLVEPAPGDLAKKSREEAAKEPAKPAPRDPFAASWNPLEWPQMEQIQFAITWGLTAIGVCLMLGLCTRPAALGGGLFMLFVVLSQPSYPGVVPPDPPQLGHALLINKDFIEMLALFLVATTSVGKWGGLDYFLDHCLLRPFLSKGACCCSCSTAKKEG
jgi:uncharacterized membrane protein YphA (DoxX/SURF4 family)